MEAAVLVGTLKVAYHLMITGIKIEQVPNAVRRCIELVRTCHRDLEDLIKLRNESLPMLETKPAILERINTIIENAHKGLLEVAQLVEKLRPEAHDGSSPLMGRLEWLFIDSREFSSQEPLISRQHSSVIAELNFLRQLILLTPLIDGVKSDKDVSPKAPEKRPMVAWDNVGLLDEMLGGGSRQTFPRTSEPVIGSIPTPSTTAAPVTVPQATPFNPRSPTPTFAEPPPPYSSPKPSSAFLSPVQVPPMHTTVTNPVVYNATVPAPGGQMAGKMGAVFTTDTKQDMGSKEKRTTFDADGMAFLFGDLKLSLQEKQTPQPLTLQQHEHMKLQQQQQYQYQHLPQQPPQHYQPQYPQTQPSPQPPPRFQVPAVKPLSTIPQELIHRHDGIEQPAQRPLFSPVPAPSQPILAPATSVAPAPPATQYHFQHQTWQQPQTQPTYAGHGVIANHGPHSYQHQISLDSPRMVNTNPSAQTQEGANYSVSVLSYATVREHWRPEYLTTHQPREVQDQLHHGQHRAVTNPLPVYTNPTAPPRAITPSLAAPEGYQQGDKMPIHTEIHELSSVVFAPDPVELE